MFHIKSANPVHDQRFQWTAFYQELATKLLAYKDDRTTLIEALHDLKDELKITILNDEAVKGRKEPLKDICPFTVFSLFNRGRYFKDPESNKVTNQKRQKIAQAIANILNVKTPAPKTFEGLPLVNNQRSWFFGYKYMRQEHDIDMLWNFFLRP